MIHPIYIYTLRRTLPAIVSPYNTHKLHLCHTRNCTCATQGTVPVSREYLLQHLLQHLLQRFFVGSQWVRNCPGYDSDFRNMARIVEFHPFITPQNAQNRELSPFR